MLLTATLPGLLNATVTCPVAVFATLPKSKLPWSVANSPRLPLQVSAKSTLLLLTALELILKVPGVVAAARFKRQELTMVIGGERKTIVVEHEPLYNALYEIESPEVLTSDAWAKAVDQGRWPGQVRPHTKNRRHVLYRRIS